MAERDIPLSVIHFDCYWMKPLQWCDFEWDRDAFPDPDGMLQRLHERGLRAALWINPYLGQRSPLFIEAAAAGYLVRRADGSVWQWDLWVAGMAIVDFTNPAAPTGSPARCAGCSTAGSTRSRPTSASASPPTWSGTTGRTRP